MTHTFRYIDLRAFMTAVRKHEDVQQYFNLDSPSQGTTLWRKLDADNSQHVDIDEFSEYVREREGEREEVCEVVW